MPNTKKVDNEGVKMAVNYSDNVRTIGLLDLWDDCVCNYFNDSTRRAWMRVVLKARHSYS